MGQVRWCWPLKSCSKAWSSTFGKVAGHCRCGASSGWFQLRPLCLPKAIVKAGLSKGDIDLWELNEAFSVVGIANNRELGLDPEVVNVHGGAVTLGHPLGSNGSRIVVTLIHALRDRGLRLGAHRHLQWRRQGICAGSSNHRLMTTDLSANLETSSHVH